MNRDKAFDAELTNLANIMGWDKWSKQDLLKLACALFWYHRKIDNDSGKSQRSNEGNQ